MISLNPTFTQLAQRKIAFFSSSILGNDIYYMKEFIDIMINVVGEDELKLLLKNDKSSNKNVNYLLYENWDKPNGIKGSLRKFDKLIEQTKASYDSLEDKALTKKDNNSYKVFMQKAKKIPAIKKDVYSLFVFLINCTSLSRMSIPQEYYKILEHRGNKPMLGMDKNRVNVPT